MMATYPSMAGDMYRVELQVADTDSEKAAEIIESLNDTSFVTELLKSENALLEGHFLLTSGKHSNKYIEKIRILQNPEVAFSICKRIASRIEDKEFDAVVGPAYGGIALAFEVARIMGKDFIFTQRKEEKMMIRSGFDLTNIKKVAIIEDIVTTGGSVIEVTECLKSLNIEVIVIAAIVDRSGGKVDFGYPFESLMSIAVPTWLPEECEMCQAGEALVKPGSSDKK
jgi:orotate phosphoribosyltransferase